MNSTDTEAAIYRASARGKLYDMRPFSRLRRDPDFMIGPMHAELYQILLAKMAPVERLENHPRLDLRSLAALGFPARRKADRTQADLGSAEA